MLRLDVVAADSMSAPVKAQLFALVRGGFAHRRKTMHSNLRSVVGETITAEIERDGRWDVKERPERWAVEQYVQLAKWLVDRVGGGSATVQTESGGHGQREQ